MNTNELESLRKQFTEIKASLSKLETEAAELKIKKASVGEVEKEKEDEGPEIEDVIAYFDKRIEYVYQSIASIRDLCYAVEDTFYRYANQHAQGHLPPIKTTSGMESALKALGMEKDYEVYKPQISVAKIRGRANVVLTLTKDGQKV